ncbi:MAG: NFACT family protein [Candidatus ainarchaeum sp.]|nr:NFACT family protein [Candidatus ainarchaeum sp.]
MRTMANLDYSYIIRELKPLEGRHLDKFYELGDGLFRMKLGSDSVLIQLGKRLHITKLLEEAPEPTGFVMKARKELGGRKLKEVRQKGRDRIIIFDFGGMELIAEMFGGGNLVLVQDGKIVYVYERKEWKDRSLKPGEEYSFPPSGEKELDGILDNLGEKSIAAELVPLNIGITYVKKMLAAAGVEESKRGSELTSAEKKKIKEVYAERMENLSPSVIIVDGKPSDYSLFPEGEPFESLSAALDECFGVAEKANPEIKKLEEMLAKQEERLRGLEQEEKDSKAKGDLIFEKYAEVEEVLEAYRKGGLAAAERIAKGKGWKLDKKNKEMEMEL